MPFSANLGFILSISPLMYLRSYFWNEGKQNTTWTYFVDIVLKNKASPSSWTKYCPARSFTMIFRVHEGRGAPFCHIPLNIKDRVPAGVIFFALCHKKTENIFLEIKIWCFTPGNRGLKNYKKLIITQKLKTIVRGCLIAQMKCFNALSTTQKIPGLCKIPTFFKNDYFWRFFLIFEEMGPRRELRFFAL